MVAIFRRAILCPVRNTNFRCQTIKQFDVRQQRMSRPVDIPDHGHRHQQLWASDRVGSGFSREFVFIVYTVLTAQ